MYSISVQRVAAARFGKTRHQRMGIRGQEHDFDVLPFFTQAHNVARQRCQRLGATRIDRYRQRLQAFLGQRGEQTGRARGQVVSAVVSRIFKDVQDAGFAGTGNVGDKYGAHSVDDNPA